MNSLYNMCACSSGLKFKFCCLEAIRSKNWEYLETRISAYPVSCFGASDIKETGIGVFTVVRELFDGRRILGSYLVDMWCLGVKDANLRTDITREEVEKFLYSQHHLAHHVKSYSYEEARSFILGSIRYAALLGIEPHADWKHAKWLIEPNRAFEDNVEFGREGQPFYVAGPYDKNIAESTAKKVYNAGGDWALPTSFSDDEFIEDTFLE
jgi:hypothetical protein